MNITGQGQGSASIEGHNGATEKQAEKTVSDCMEQTTATAIFQAIIRADSSLSDQVRVLFFNNSRVKEFLIKYVISDIDREQSSTDTPFNVFWSRERLLPLIVRESVLNDPKVTNFLVGHLLKNTTKIGMESMLNNIPDTIRPFIKTNPEVAKLLFDFKIN